MSGSMVSTVQNTGNTPNTRCLSVIAALRSARAFCCIPSLSAPRVCLLVPLSDLKAPLSLFKTHTHTNNNPTWTSVWFRERLGLVWPQVRVSALTSTVMATDVQDIPRARKQEFQLCGNLCFSLALNCSSSSPLYFWYHSVPMCLRIHLVGSKIYLHPCHDHKPQCYTRHSISDCGVGKYHTNTHTAPPKTLP